MKKLNATAEFEAVRRQFLLNKFRRVIATQSQIAIRNAFHATADAPAPRFWVSETRAAAIMGKMLAGNDPTPRMNREKKDMFQEIFRRFMKIRVSSPERSIADIVFDVVNAPAPKSYISWQRVKAIIYKELHRLRRERKEKTCR
ncbi:MAG: hypothetical protein HDR88_14185 [Bacteroides sp.]|nr:hypothetical protein [Bacteroides sp.]